VKHYVAARCGSELDGAGAAYLVKGVEAPICAAGAQAARRRLRRATEQVAVQPRRSRRELNHVTPSGFPNGSSIGVCSEYPTTV
jgi:hypothetical protein